MFRSNRDIEVYLREWMDLSDVSRQQTIDALESENLILLEQYVKRGYIFEKQSRYWQMLKSRVDEALEAVRIWRVHLEEQLYGKMLTLDTHTRRKEYEESLNQLDRKRLVLLQEVQRRQEEVDSIWEEMVDRLLFTRELGRRMTWLKDACLEMEALLTSDIYQPGRIAGKWNQSICKGVNNVVTAENPLAWIDLMMRMSQTLMHLVFYAGMEVKEPREVLGIVLLMAVFDHRGSTNWFLANGFAEEQIPPLKEWENNNDIELEHYQRLMRGPILRKAFEARLFHMADADPREWPEDLMDPFWALGIWTDEEFFEEADRVALEEEDHPIPEYRRGPQIVR